MILHKEIDDPIDWKPRQYNPKELNKRQARSKEDAEARGYLGVTIGRSETKRYQAQIRVNGKMKYLGSFETARAAAEAYNLAAAKVGKKLNTFR